MKHGSLISPDEGSFGFGTSKSMFEATSAGHQSGETVTVPDAELLFNGEFKRAGDDLKIIGQDGKSFLVEDYFKKDKHPTLLSPEGAALTGDVVDALAGPLAPGQYAQAGAPQSANQAIGRVEKVEGNATVVRNGVTITLNTGDVIQKGDVAQTGSGGSLAIVFSDGTAFNLAANARMVLNDFVYSAGGSNNSALISLVQGSISFVAGQVAKTGDMRVETPVATMGIRGTAVLVEVSANNGQTKFSVMVEPNGEVGSFNLYDKSTGNLIATVNSSSIGWVVTPTGPLQVIAQQVQKTPAELARELFIMQQVFQTFNSGPFDPNAPQPPQPPSDPNKRGDTDTNTKTAGGPSGTPGSVTGDVVKVNIVSPTGANGQTGPSNPTNPNSTDPNAGDPTGPGDPGAPGAPDGPPQTQTLPINYVYGSANNDNPLAGSDDDDMIFGGAGDDVFIAAHGKGNDFFDGDGDGDNPALPDFEGPGFDTIRYDSASGVTFDLVGIAELNHAFSTSTGLDTFTNIEKVVGSPGDDVFNLHANGDWVIDGGSDIETEAGHNDFDVIALIGEFDITDAPGGIEARNIEMLDLDNNAKNKIYLEGEGVVDINDDHTIRVVADGKDTVILSGGGDEGHWVRVGTPQIDVTDGEGGLFAGSDHHTDGVQFQQYEFVDDYGCVKATVYVDADATIDIAPIAGADSITNATPPDGEGWMLNEVNGHYYRVVEQEATWQDAAYYAELDGAYLATITSASEQAFVQNLASGVYAWLGGYGSIATDVNTWHWITGPENGSSFFYENWFQNAEGHEPNGWENEIDAYLELTPNGTWNDTPGSWNQQGYVEEWGGLPNQIAFREDTGTTLTVAQLLQNDTDAEGNPLTITGVGATSAHGGAVTLVNGIITYIPAANYNGADSFTYTLSDGTAVTTGTVSFNVAPVNDPPALDLDADDSSGATGADYQAAIVFGEPMAVLDSDATITDASTLNSATIQLTGEGFGGNTDYPHTSLTVDTSLLADSTGNGFSGSWRGISWQYSGGSSNLQLQITGNGSTADYLQVLHAARMQFDSATSNTAANVTVTVHSDSGYSNTATTAVDIPNRAPDINVYSWNGNSANATTNETDSPPSLSGTLTISDLENDPLTVTVTELDADGPLGAHSENDFLGFLWVTPPTGGGAQYTWHFAPDNETFDYLNGGESLILHYTIHASDGSATDDQIVNITINGTDETPPNEPPVANDDTLTGNIAGFTYNPANGHWYKAADIADYKSWSDAQAAAVAAGGYLATITSLDENQFILDLLTNVENVWIGGSDSGKEGVWRWAGGPEDGLQFWQGGPAPNGVPLLYANWHADEPNAQSGEDFAIIGEDGTWNDVASATSNDTREYVTEVSIVEDVDSVIPAAFLLANDSDPEGQTLSIDSVSATSANGGTVTLLDNGNVQYRSAQDYNGPDSFTYTVTDGEKVSTEVTVTFNVAAANEAPVISIENADTTEFEGSTILTGLSVTDGDEDELQITFEADHGTLQFVDSVGSPTPAPSQSFSAIPAILNPILGDGITYTPPALDPENPELTDKITLTADDGHVGGTDTVNFLFKVFGEGGVVLTGDDGKDVLFDTGHRDIFTGGLGADTFVFSSHGTPSSQVDTITDFDIGTDKIMFAGPAQSFGDLTVGFDPNAHTVTIGITTSPDQTIVLENMAQLPTANDFIFHA